MKYEDSLEGSGQDVAPRQPRLEGGLRPAHLRGGGRRLALPEAAAVHSERQGGAGRRLRTPVQGKAQTRD